MDLGPVLRERHQQLMRASRIKLIAMIVVLFIVIVAMWELNRRAKRSPDQAASTAQEQQGGEEATPAKKPQVDTKGHTTLPEGEGPDAEPLAPAKGPAKLAAQKAGAEEKPPAAPDPKVLEQVIDQNLELERGPFLYMLHLVAQDTPEKLRAEADTTSPWTALWENGSAFRGKAVRVSGELAQTWDLSLPENPTGLTKAYAYRVRVENAPVGSKGHFYDVYTMEKLKGALPRDRVAAFGRFLKPMVSEAPRLDDPDFHVAVVLARALERPTYLDDPKMPGPVVDGNRAEARPLYWLLKRAQEAPFEELKVRANRKLTHLDFVTRPESYRGKPVAVTGQLRRLIRIALPENLLGMTDVYYGQIADIDRQMNTFYCLEVPEGVHENDPVILYGYFLKKWTYSSIGSYEVHSPVLVAKRMLVVDYGEAGSGYALEIALAAVFGVTALALAVALTLSRRRDRKLADARRQREFERAQAKLHAAAQAKDSSTEKSAP